MAVFFNFDDEQLISKDSAFNTHQSTYDVIKNKKTAALNGIQDLFIAGPSTADIPLTDNLIIVAAAGDLAGERMEALNAKLQAMQDAGEAFCCILAGAGHYALPPAGTPEDEIDFSTHINPKFVHAALTNMSAGNSHTKSYLRNPQDNLTYIAASHCLTEDFGGGAEPTIPFLANSNIIPNDNVFIYDAVRYKGQLAEKDQTIVGTGTGAPPAALSVYDALRQQAGIDTPLNVHIAGMDGTADIIHCPVSEIPAERLEGRAADKLIQLENGQSAFIDPVYEAQMSEIAFIATAYPERTISLNVDSPDNTLSAQIFNTPDGKPNTSFKIGHLENFKPGHP
ncbi:MAG: hypothetical protein CMH26_05105 [Micavibrio sp.]|nr:hypothetical protein [Micavibrio sp.]|tara:strand:- start:274 stop:1290 length:1017 start_codon:yes stop_codon:yes gene_type:complete